MIVLPQHRRSLVFLILFLQLPIRNVVIWRRDLSARHNTRKRNAYADRPVQPTWRWPANELFAEVAREVVAVVGQQVV